MWRSPSRRPPASTGTIFCAPPCGRWRARSRRCPIAPQLVLVDGRDRIAAPCDCEAVVHGDAIVASIAAASIVAKVTRDRLMARLGLAHPGYGFERHMGYSVPEHFDALLRLGPTIHHRRTFAPVAARYDDLGAPPAEILPGLLPPDLSA